MRDHLAVTVSNPTKFREQLLALACQFEVACLLDSNHDRQNTYKKYDLLFAAGVHHEIQREKEAFSGLQEALQVNPDWYFGYLSYDLKKEVEDLASANRDVIGAPLLYFFCPKIVITVSADTATISCRGFASKVILDRLENARLPKSGQPENVIFSPRMDKEDYLARVDAIRNHIIEGDVYEMNLCQEFFAEGANLNSINLFNRFNGNTRSPFAAYFQKGDLRVLCSSPERFLMKKGNKLISQPIKGTNKRVYPEEHNAIQRNALYASEKDRAENVMIVDLVRNDLARSCESGSVQVEELFGIYTFPQVNHMISTVTGKLKPDTHYVDAIRQAFPMGSMTGAPKVKAMELIESYELSKRGIYSGALGYFDPWGDFDLNVVIRSMIYRSDLQYLSYQVGGAIVYDSVPENEYQECLLKAEGMTRLFQDS